MKVNEDLFVAFLKNEGRKVFYKHSYLSGIGATITKIETESDEKWTFIGYAELKRHVGKFEADDNNEYNLKWQNFILAKTTGIQRDSLLERFIYENKNKLKWSLESLSAEDADIEDVQTHGDEILKHILGLEELKFVVALDKCKHELDFKLQEEVVRSNMSEYGNLVQNEINKLLESVPRTIDESGQEVFNFTQEQIENYDRLKEIAETTNFTFRYQIYRLDQQEQKMTQAEA